MDLGILVLRLLHIGSGVFWAGSAMFFFFFLEPATKALGPQAGPVMHFLVSQKRVARVITVAATVNVAAGALVYWRVSNGFDPAWTGSGMGIGLTIGAIAAIGAWAMGLAVIMPTVERIDAVGGQIAQAGGPPSPELLGEMHRLSEKLHRIGRIDIALIGTAVFFMAISRYLVR